MNIDEKAFIPDILVATWPEKTLISRKTMTARHLRRRRAAARAKWPMYLPEPDRRPPAAQTRPQAELERGRSRQLSRQFPARYSALGLSQTRAIARAPTLASCSPNLRGYSLSK